MLFVYGSLMPLRILEEIRFWKMQEKEHTTVIRQLVPTLEPQYVKLLEEWEQVFAKTEAISNRWIEAVIRSHETIGPALQNQVHGLIRTSTAQSREFIRQLFTMMDQSEAVKRTPTADVVIAHIIRESEYFLGVLQAVAHHSPAYRFDGDGIFPEAAFNPEGTWSSPLGSSPSSSAADARAVPIGGHVLPPLPYPYNALEPHIDETTMRLHHDIHHKSYVDGLNKAETMMEKARKSGDFDLIKHWEREAAFNGAGHYLHTIFWNVMSPNGGGKPSGDIAKQIDKDFGSFEAFKKHFSAAAEKVEGGGWAILVWSPRSHHLEILQAEKHQNLSQWDVVPLLVLDVWEHAYYLKYRNERAKYIDAWWNVVHWPHVNERFVAARQLKWKPY